MALTAVVPAHDAGTTIGRTIRSIQRQTVPVDEIVVVDDHSVDDTAGVVSAMAEDDPRIVLLHADGRGAGHARNTGVLRATGDVIAFLDADDVWYPDKLEHQLPLLTDDVAFAGALVHYLGEDGSVLGSYLPFDDFDEATASLRRGETMPVSLAFSVLRRQVFLEAGGFDESFLRTQDLELAQRLVADGRRRVVWPRGRALGGYVLHRGGVSATSYTEQFLAAELVRARLQGRTDASYEEWQMTPDLDAPARRALRSGVHYRRAAVARGNRDQLGVVGHGVAAVAHDPIGVARKLVRRRRHVGVLEPAGPPPEVLAEFTTAGPVAGAAEAITSTAEVPTTTVAGLELAEDPQQLAEVAVTDYLRRPRPLSLVAAHVTSLNRVDDEDFVTDFNAADGRYVDGLSWSLIARAGGGTARKAATSDLAPQIITDLSERLGRDVRVAVLGGERHPDPARTVAARAAARLEADLPVDAVHAVHGYQDDWDGALARLRAADPDVVLIGMGMPLEAHLTARWRPALPDALIVTCGGWLRILAGDEERAPEFMQRAGLEWLHRLLGDPRRTACRYTVGALNLARHAGAAALGRVTGGRLGSDD